MVAAGATWTRWTPLRVSSIRVFVPVSTALTNPVPALTYAAARGSSAAAADRTDNARQRQTASGSEQQRYRDHHWTLSVHDSSVLVPFT
jgi:hypothetical protein